MKRVMFMNPVSFLTKTIHLIIDNIDRNKSEIVKWMWIYIKMQSNIRSIALIIVIIDIKSMTIHTFGNLLICLTNVLHVTTFTFNQINNILRCATCWMHLERLLGTITCKNTSFNNIFTIRISTSYLKIKTFFSLLHYAKVPTTPVDNLSIAWTVYLIGVAIYSQLSITKQR